MGAGRGCRRALLQLFAGYHAPALSRCLDLPLAIQQPLQTSPRQPFQPPPPTLPHLAADLVMVLADVRQSKGLMSHAAVLSLAGLVSGCLSAYKNWPGTQR